MENGLSLVYTLPLSRVSHTGSIRLPQDILGLRFEYEDSGMFWHRLRQRYQQLRTGVGGRTPQEIAWTSGDSTEKSPEDYGLGLTARTDTLKGALK